jgi:NAD(P)-dependent dehydrogenase (short-subunit alcohol dehydrogenase family)
MNGNLPAIFDLEGRVAIITGGLGLMGRRHSEAIAGVGGIPVLIDLPGPSLPADEHARLLASGGCILRADITQEPVVLGLLEEVLARYGRVDILINNAANNPKMEAGSGTEWSRLETFPLAQWDQDLAVGLKGAFLCSRVFGGEMARRNRGVILNIASDLALIGPDQRIYRKDGLPEDLQPVKPLTYSVVKAGLLGLTRYLATYWADRGVRVNAISPGGIFTNQPEGFVQRLTNLIPMGRMAQPDEYMGAILFLCSDASSYMTGANLVIDGGRTCW